jgi:hypothetical protein
MQHLCVQVLLFCTESPHYTRPLPAPFSCSIGYALEICISRFLSPICCLPAGSHRCSSQPVWTSICNAFITPPRPSRLSSLSSLSSLSIVPRKGASFTEDSADSQLLYWGPRKVRDFLGRGRTTATLTNQVSSLLQVRSDEVAIYYGVP